MIVRYIKAMKPEDISRLTEARTKTEAFSTALNLDFLSAALNLPERKLIKPENSFFSPYDRTILNEKLGNIATPTHWFVQTFKQMGYKVFEKVSLDALAIPAMTLQLSLINLLGKNFEKADLLLIVGEKNHFSPLELQFGFLKDPLQSKESVLSFINYFYNRKELYFKVFATLLENKEKLKKYTTKPFLKALLSLFSVKDFKTEVPDFDIPATKLKLAVRGAENFFEPVTSRKEILGFYNPGRGLIESVKLLLLEDNSLAIDFYFFDEMLSKVGKILTKENLEIAKENPLFDKFIAENLNLWLKNILLLTAFEEKVYNKIRTKILLESI